MSKWDKLLARICGLSRDLRFDELRKVLELGVDLLQGYCLARPAAVPPPLSKEAADIIHRMKRC